jgi:hypothetical protein
MKKNQNISLAKAGMSRDLAVDSLDQQAYSIAINANMENESGELYKLKSEHSNILASKFKAGFRVIGFEVNEFKNETLFLLVNPETGVSEIGKIKNSTQISSMNDVERECPECNYERVLQTPLEDTNQPEHQVYETLLTDDCPDAASCLNFNINYPVRRIVVKNEKLATKWFWTDGLNPPRYLDESRLDEYKTTGTVVCGVDNTQPTCIDCGKLRVFPQANPLSLEVESIELGGNLGLGTYSFFVAYADQIGQVLSEYHSLTEQVSIFDPNNRIRDNIEEERPTNFAIKLKVSGADPQYRYYKVVGVYTNSVDQGKRYFDIGLFPVTNEFVLVDTIQGKVESQVADVLRPAQNIKTLAGFTEANNHLLGFNVTREKEWNLQPVVNLMGPFLKWQTHVATERLYENGELGSKYKGYFRDEVYPLGISFRTNTGFRTAIFPLIGRPALNSDRQLVVNADSNSLNNNSINCAGGDRTERWEIYNTAAVEGQFPFNFSTSIVTEPAVKASVTPWGVDVNGSFIIDDPEIVNNFTTLENFIEQDLEDGCVSGAPYCDAADPNTPPCPVCQPTVPTFNNCGAPEEYGAPIVRLNQLVNDSVVFNQAPWPSGYRALIGAAVCSMYQASSSGDGFQRDGNFEDEYFPGANQVYYRNYTFTNDRPRNALALEPVADPKQPVNTLYFHNYLGFTGNSQPDVLAQATQADYTITGFSTTADLVTDTDKYGGDPFSRIELWHNTLHQGALWFSVDVEENPDGVIEVIRAFNPDGDDIVDNSERIRVTIWEDNTPGNSLYYTRFNIARGGFRTKIEYNQDTGRLILLSDDNTPQELVNIPNFKSGETTKRIYIAIDCALEGERYDSENKLVVAPTRFCFGVALRGPEFDSITASYDAVSFELVQRFRATCSTEVPVIGECQVEPYEYGSFAYWESTAAYPDNQELYDSSGLNIEPTDFINSGVASEFESLFTTGVVGGEYQLDPTETNFSCKPIRHFKFPDNEVSPFMYDSIQSGFNDTLVFPLGVTIDDNIINEFLNIAVKNNLITAEQRASVVEYEIYRGDRTLDKGVVAKGLLYDMYNYVEDERTIWYSNFPYNDLGRNQLFYDEDRVNRLEHPNNDKSNSNYTFHSPETEFAKPTLPTDLKVEGYQFGKSKGVFEDVEDHPRYVILGGEAKRLAKRLATLEVISEAAIIAAESAEVFRVQIGVSNSGNPIGIGLNIAAVALNAIGSAVYKYARYKFQWEQSFRENGDPHNFASYYTSVGKYNYLDSELSTMEGNKVRGINKATYLRDGRFIIVNEAAGEKYEINNFQREESVFISLGLGNAISHKNDYLGYDNGDIDPSANSRITSGEAFVCRKGRSVEIERNIASPYVSLKNYLPSQYGTIDSINWLTTSYRGKTDTPISGAKPIFGGDAFIARHTLKRKMPLFLRTGMGLSDFTPFNYRSYGNLGQQPAFYGNFLSPDEITFDRDLPQIYSEHIFDCQTRLGAFYIEPPSKMYLYYYGIPSFLTETTLNLNYRTGGVQPKDQFYPLFGDYVQWTQQNFIPINERNIYQYNPVYTTKANFDISRTLPATYSAEEFDTVYDSPNGLVYSRPDNNENSLTEPWLTFLPNDRYDFPTTYGQLVEVKGIEKEFVMCRFDMLTATFNAIDTIIDDGTKPETQNLGDGFKRRPVTFYETDLGYGGSQSADSISCELGHFFVDAKRGQVFRMLPGAQGLEEISAVVNGKPSGMRNWFKSHLPFKILSPVIENFESINTDNPYNGVGIVMGWDSRHKRIFLTKKDYKPRRAMTYIDGKFYDGATEIQLNNSTYFEDVSFTVAYSALTGTWLSYYDFHPNYYLAHNNYFQTGINIGTADQFGLWSHLLTNKSYGVFYGTKHDVVIEYPIKNDFASKTLENIQLWTSGLRYHNDHDYSYNRDINFNKMYVLNRREASGLLHLVPQKTLRDNVNYPKTFQDYQEVLMTNTNDRWNVNYLFNRVKSEYNNQPIFNWDENQIRRTFNKNAVAFKGKRVLEPLRGSTFLVNLAYDKDSRFQIEFDWATNEEDLR